MKMLSKVLLVLTTAKMVSASRHYQKRQTRLVAAQRRRLGSNEDQKEQEPEKPQKWTPKYRGAHGKGKDRTVRYGKSNYEVETINVKVEVLKNKKSCWVGDTQMKFDEEPKNYASSEVDSIVAAHRNAGENTAPKVAARIRKHHGKQSKRAESVKENLETMMAYKVNLKVAFKADALKYERHFGDKENKKRRYDLIYQRKSKDSSDEWVCKLRFPTRNAKSFSNGKQVKWDEITLFRCGNEDQLQKTFQGELKNGNTIKVSWTLDPSRQLKCYDRPPKEDIHVLDPLIEGEEN